MVYLAHAYCSLKKATQHLGCFSSELGAAKRVAQAKKVKLVSLLLVRRRAPGVPAVPAGSVRGSRFQGVSRRTRPCGGSAWVAQWGRGGWLGTFETEAEAKAAILAAGGTAASRPSSQQVDLTEHVARITVMLRIYDDGRAMPGDLASAIRHRIECPAFSQNAPFLQQLSLRGKDGPWKAALREAWWLAGSPTLMAMGSSVPAEAQRAAQAAHSILAQAARAMVGVERTEWARNLGRGVSHHHGWLAMLRAYSVLRVATPGATNTIKLGCQGVRYVVVPFSVSVHMQKFQQAHRMAVLLDMVGAPRTLDEWERAVGQVGRCANIVGLDLPSARSPQSPTSTEGTPMEGYHWPWYLRSHLLVEMRAAGISKLEFNPSMSVEAFAPLFPDQGRWIETLARHAGNVDSITGVLRLIHYQGPIELLSMWLCLCGDRSVTSQPAERLAANEGHLRVARRAYVAAHGLEPHPAVLVGLLSE